LLREIVVFDDAEAREGRRVDAENKLPLWRTRAARAALNHKKPMSKKAFAAGLYPGDRRGTPDPPDRL